MRPSKEKCAQMKAAALLPLPNGEKAKKKGPCG
jgi:hypothetical protein